ncbi:MAG: transporter [Vicinamibacterales bacterium]
MTPPSWLAFSTVLLTACAAPAAAQETVGDVIGFLVTNQAVVTSDAARDRAAAEAARSTISNALLFNLASVPLASSSTGFLYRFNSEIGTMERASESFGSFFVERALTAGRGHASFAVSASTSGFDGLNGANLRDGSFVTVANKFRDESTPFDTETLTLRVRSSTMTLFGSVGLTDRLEIGAAVPLVDLTVEGERQNQYFDDPFLQASGKASASGVADIAVRAKYGVAASRSAAFALAAEVRLPTGDSDNLLGAGSTAYRFLGIGSYETGRVAVSGNAGLVFGGVSNEMIFGSAGSFAASPRVTVTGELLVRHVTDLQDTALVSAPHPTIIGVDTLRLSTTGAGMTLANAVAGIKWNVSGTLVLGGHVVIPLAHRGLTAPLTPTVALEYRF